MGLVAQYNVQAELAPHKEESRRQGCVNFAAGSWQLILFFWVPKTQKNVNSYFFLSVAFCPEKIKKGSSWQLIFFMFVDVNKENGWQSIFFGHFF